MAPEPNTSLSGFAYLVIERSPDVLAGQDVTMATYRVFDTLEEASRDVTRIAKARSDTSAVYIDMVPGGSVALPDGTVLEVWPISETRKREIEAAAEEQSP